jgi:gliding motility-associated-like protein
LLNIKTIWLLGLIIAALSISSLFAQPLTAIGDNVVVCQPGPQVIDVQANDQAQGGGSYTGQTYLFVNTTAKGTISLINGDSVLYTPNPGAFGQDNFQYFIGDTSLGNISIGNVVIDIKARPDVTGEYVSTRSGTSVIIDVQTNDIANNGSLSTFLNGLAQNGTATVLGQDSILFNPNIGFVGQGIVNYRVCNVCGCDSGTIIISVEPPCVTPSATNDLIDVAPEAVRFVDVLANDNLQGQLPSGLNILTAPQNGSPLATPAYRVRYQSNPGFIGSDSLQYLMMTDCGMDSAWLIINVSDSSCTTPLAIDDEVITPWSDSCGGLYDVLRNDFDPAGQGLTISLLDTAFIGSASVLNNRIAYTPSGNIADTAKTDSFRYSICNACGCDTAWLKVEYGKQSCNATDPVAANDAFTICAGDSIILDLLANDFDADGDLLKYLSITAQPSSGAGTVSILNDTQLVFVSNPAFTGNDYFYYQISDGGVPEASDIALVEITQLVCDNPPSFQLGAGNNIDSLTVVLFEDADSLICFNLPDPDGDAVSITSITGGYPGSIAVQQDTCIFLQTTPDSSGQGTFIVIACDDRQPLCDTLILTVIVVPVNDPPVAVNDSFRFTWTGTLTFNPLANDSDPENHPISLLQLLDAPQIGTAMQSGGGLIDYTPDSSRAGRDTFRYIVCDSLGACDTGLIYILVPVHAVDDNVITDYETPITLTVIGNDIRSFTTYVFELDQAANGTAVLNPDGSYTYTPDPGFNGQDQFSYYICDTVDTELGCDTALVNVTVSEPAKQVVVPEGFSPNGDGINDYLVIENINFFPNAELIVFNRWGSEVWRSEGGYADNFDGKTMDGDNLPDGTYYFVLKLMDPAFPDPGGYIIINR